MLAPLLFLIDNLLHPKEFKTGHEVDQLAEIAAQYGRWQFSHFLGFLALLLFVVATLGLAYLVRRKRPTAGLVGGTLAMLGLMCLAAVIALDGYTWGELGKVSGQGLDEETMIEVLNRIQQSSWSYQYYVPALAFAIGLITLAVVAARSGIVPVWAGYLLALGALLAGTEGIIVSNAYYVIGAIVLLAGGAAVARSIWRMDDEEFVRGGEPPPEPETESSLIVP